MRIVQFIHSKLVQPSTIESLSGPNPFTWCSDLFPYTVPPGHWLGITDIQFGSKFTDGGLNARASMLVLNNVITVPDNGGSVHFRVPLVLPPTKNSGVPVVLTADFINNDAEQQWMSSAITGILVPQVEGQGWRDAFGFLFNAP